jgi:hypothetical protein
LKFRPYCAEKYMKNTSIINVGVLKKICGLRTGVMFPITSRFDLDWFDSQTSTLLYVVCKNMDIPTSI